uniref:Uncharacterized protein n=1 Tax=Grammatophora oceanica TaxID=210454 RepID=A0A7S1Y3F9_9STRA|mmetsp:Transcript_21379/g.31820  ORF Transcript_21379/g.31820 Transcript_21379/m.31820 type:complete len:291 (+) Transcript_21379:111-983(+)|eukprot:CAMPEP_0194030186 /NCGR_PEP_ID=MMETSP0009_2-20130614/3759_1 /TAXON_ID=210454 /ORGANISM="Grammatophora oceanica, Strain CCMP 410" /LENGTH=290 /DNA_ID=CAMNT_0038670089 /DNA_START=111 /DNA_END=983 /DNA_ORIENTATION=-
MADGKYQIVSSDEEIAVSDAKLLPSIKPVATMTPSKKSSTVWKSLLKFLLVLALAVVIVFSMLGMAAYHFGHHVMHHVGQMVVPQITTQTPLDLPEVHLSKHELHALKKRLRTFHHDLHHGKTPEHDLVLTEQEINGLICDNDHHHDDNVCGHVHTTILENRIEADFSFPADDAPGGEGRYLVGKKTVVSVPDENKESAYAMHHTLTVHGGPQDEDFTVMDATSTIDLAAELNVQILSAEMFGWMATDAFVQRFLEGRNWAEHMCPEAKKAVSHIAGVSIGDGKIVVHVE